MIVCHDHRFIFIKTRKTAGTALEIALSSLCGPSAIITPISKTDEDLRRRYGFRGQQNFAKPWYRYSFLEVQKYLKNGRPAGDFTNHMSAQAARALLPRQVWDGYLKFTIVRDPWDRLVSEYFWQTRERRRRSSFEDWLTSHPGVMTQNWRMITEGNTPLLDRCLRYERIGPELDDLSAALGLTSSLATVFGRIRAKGHHRPPGVGRGDPTLMTAVAIETIRRHAAREIEAFGYEPPTPALPRRPRA